MKVEYLKYDDNKVYWFDRQLDESEFAKFQNGELQGTFERDFVEPVKFDEYQLAYEQLNADIKTGEKLIKEFMVDNRLSPTVTTANAPAMLQVFGNAKTLAECGDLKNVKAILQSITIDEIYTQERHDKYMSILDLN